jgi:hypothetical protein
MVESLFLIPVYLQIYLRAERRPTLTGTPTTTLRGNQQPQTFANRFGVPSRALLMPL